MEAVAERAAEDLPVHPSPFREGTLACTGIEFCKLAIVDTKGRAQELYRELDCGWVECGGIRLACTPEREQEIHRQVAWARTFGLPLELIAAEEAREKFPLMVTDGVRVGSFLPTDGYLDPSLLTHALAEKARKGGAKIFTHTRVTAIGVERGRVTSVETEWGTIECEVVVNAGGMYAAEIGRMARKVAAGLPAGATEKQKLAALERHLFREKGFHGSRGDYYNRSNSYLSEVIDDREGLPITLSVLYLELARRLERETGGDPAQIIDRAYRLALGRAPTDEEQKLSVEYLREQPLAEFALALFNLNGFLYVP